MWKKPSNIQKKNRFVMKKTSPKSELGRG